MGFLLKENVQAPSKNKFSKNEFLIILHNKAKKKKFYSQIFQTPREGKAAGKFIDNCLEPS